MRVHDMNSPAENVTEDHDEEDELVVGDNQSEQSVIEQCPFCNIGFISQKTLSAHLASDHPGEKLLDVDELNADDGWKFSCKSCGAIFDDEVDLEAHVLLDHDAIDANCDVCEAKFKSQRQLDDHRLEHDLTDK